MGCTASRHLGRPASSMEGRSSAPTQHASTHSMGYSVEYHHHFVALTSSSYGLLKSAQPSEPVGPSNCDRSRIGSLNEMYDKLESLESAQTANIVPWPCEMLKSPSGGDLSYSPSAHHAWCVDSAQFVVSETINVREMMMGFEEEGALSQGTPPSGIRVCPAQTGASVSRQRKTKPLHTIEQADVVKKPGKANKHALDEDEYESGKENSLPEQVQHSMLAPPRRCPSMDTSLSQTLKPKEAHARGVSSIIKSSPKASVSPSMSQMVQNSATSKRGKVEHTQHNKQHWRRSTTAFAPLVVSSTTSMSRRFVVRESSSSADPSSPLFDPDMVASYEKALKTISEESWNACLVSPEVDRRRTPASIHRETKLLDIGNLEPPAEDAEQKIPSMLERFEEKCPPGGAMMVVLYTTSLRGIRKTFEDCNTLRSILQSYGLSIDERDVSMHLEFLNELRKLMDRVVCVPRLFIKGRYIGGVEEVAKLHENGELKELMEGLPREENAGACDGCDGIRFVPCLECRGSRKVRSEDDKIQKCPDCNENGLIQCPICT